MSLTSIMNNATSGLTVAQAQLRVVSDNVSNVNTPGYVRKIADQVAFTTGGVGAGVDIARVRLATDRFLQAASLSSGADAARESVRYELYDRIQALFGDPGGDRGFFSQIDSVFSVFSSMAENPASTPLRQDTLLKVQGLFDESRRISSSIQSVRADADSRLRSAVDNANSLIKEIETLNVAIARAEVVGEDSTGAQSIQSGLISQLSQLMDISVTQRANGGVNVRTGGGVLLAGAGHAELSYQPAASVNAETNFNQIWITEPHGGKRVLTDSLSSGEIKGLLELRDVEAPAAAARLSELMTRVADELNRAHNANTAIPAPSSLSGRNVGQSLATALEGFTGRTTIALVDDQGIVQSRAEIDFSGGIITINGAASSAATFLADLSAQTGGQLTANFFNGALNLEATGGLGLSIADDAATPSDKAGRGFSHYFGLNDLIVSNRQTVYDQGLTQTSSHGFTAGETVTFRFTDGNGSKISDVKVAVPAGAGTMAELLAALNNPVGGVGRFGSFALSAAGELTFTGIGDPAPRLSVVEDLTQQVPSQMTMTDLFGLGQGTRTARGEAFSVRADIRQNSARMALAQLNLGAAAGAIALSSGDGRGAQKLADAGQRATSFASAGGAPANQMSISRYAADLSGDIGGRAASAKSRSSTATALFTEASARQTAYEGVNLDEELVKMTTYQQAFNASARLIQAVSDMYDVLLGMT